MADDSIDARRIVGNDQHQHSQIHARVCFSTTEFWPGRNINGNINCSDEHYFVSPTAIIIME